MKCLSNNLKRDGARGQGTEDECKEDKKKEVLEGEIGNKRLGYWLCE